MTLPYDLLIIRHGETVWNRAGRWQGVQDSALTDVGIEQARTLGRMLGVLGVTPAGHAFHVSPQGRARQTAALILGHDQWEQVPDGILRVDPRLSEIDVGAFTALTQAEVRQRAGLPEDCHFLDYYRAAPGAESFSALWARTAAFLKDLDGPAVLVTHGVTSRFLRAVALDMGIDRIAELPGGQGVIHRISGGRHLTIAPDDVLPLGQGA